MVKTISLAEYRRTALEHPEQAAFVQWFHLTYPAVLIHSVPNGAHLSISQALKLAAEGLVSGIPDLHVPEWDLWIEMKRPRGGRLSVEQEEVIRHLRAIGQTVIVAKGWEDAAQQVRELAL
jgi:hypothetical protein